jgi:hypothetical protein
MADYGKRLIQNWPGEKKQTRRLTGKSLALSSRVGNRSSLLQAFRKRFRTTNNVSVSEDFFLKLADYRKIVCAKRKQEHSRWHFSIFMSLLAPV